MHGLSKESGCWLISFHSTRMYITITQWQMPELRRILVSALGVGSDLDPESVEITCKGEIVRGGHHLFFVERYVCIVANREDLSWTFIHHRRVSISAVCGIQDKMERRETTSGASLSTKGSNVPLKVTGCDVGKEIDRTVCMNTYPNW